MSGPLVLTLSPHDKGPVSIGKIMWGVNLALVPALLVQALFFGWAALATLGVSMVCALATEAAIQKFLFKKPLKLADGSAAVTGLLMALNVPATLPLWMSAVGAVFAIAVGKMAFGGIGRNPFNPALVGRAFLLASFPVEMTSWPEPNPGLWGWFTDALTAATPLGQLKEGGADQVAWFWAKYLQGAPLQAWYPELLAAALLAGGLAMLKLRIIKWHIPVFYLGGLGVFTGLFWLADPQAFADPGFHLLTGGVFLGAWFMATDYSTSPMNTRGQILYALGAGVLTGVIRLFGSYPDGVAYSILLMNALTPLINKYIRPKPFGRRPNHAAA